MAVPHFDEERTGDEVNIIARVDTVIRTVYNPEEAPRTCTLNKIPADQRKLADTSHKSAKMNLWAHLPTRGAHETRRGQDGKEEGCGQGRSV